MGWCVTSYYYHYTIYKGGAIYRFGASCLDHGTRLDYNVRLHLRVVWVRLQDVLGYIYGIHEPVGFEVVECEAEADSTVLLVAHLPRLLIVVGGIHVALLLLLYQAHVFLGLHHRLVVFQALYQLLFRQVVFVAGDEKVGEEKPRLLEMLCELQLVVILKTGLQVVTPIRLLLLDELAQSHAHQCGDVVLVLSEQILKSLGCKLQIRFLLSVDHGVALDDGGVDPAVVKLCYQILGGTDVVWGGCVLRLSSGLGH